MLIGKYLDNKNAKNKGNTIEINLTKMLKKALIRDISPDIACKKVPKIKIAKRDWLC